MLPTINKYLLYLLAAILVSRFIPMVLVPFADPTEARYGEIARIMMETGDWITPYFNYDVPFWGKPPLSFWAQALSFHIFGINEFAPRFPSWLATIAIMWLMFRLLVTVANQHAAILACLIFVSCLLAIALSGAVLTDPYLALAVTLSLVAFVMVRHQQPGLWRYWFFIGLALGLLSKGPIAVVLVIGPIGIWLIMAKHRWQVLKRFPWVTGVLLTVALTLPWYIAAELKTPGFIEYFIVGEHFYRFVDAGWAGDLYGSAHKHPKGTIWILWLVASLPWGVVALIVLLKQLLNIESRLAMRRQLGDDDISFYIIWALFPMCFFSLAGNVLWTYALPALPPLAVLLALYFSRSEKETETHAARWVSLGALASPIILLTATLYLSQHPEILPTEKHLISHYNSVATANDNLIFVGKRSFSARYYSQGKADLMTVAQLKEKLLTDAGRPFYIAVPNKEADKIRSMISRPTNSLFRSNKYQLLKILDGDRSSTELSSPESR